MQHLGQRVAEAHHHAALDLALQPERIDRAPDVVSGDPFVSPYTHKVLVPFGRRLVGHRGRVDGAVIATFTPESLRNFYGCIDAEGGVVRVLNRNGAVLLEEPQIANSYVDAHILNGEGQGILRGPIAEGGPAMITAYDASGDTELFVAVSLSEAQALAAWRQEAIVGGLIIAARSPSSPRRVRT